MLPNWFYTVGWVGWILYFVVLETIALIDRDPGDTLSEHVWKIFGFHSIVWWIGLGVLGWLIVHLLSYGKLA